MKVRKKGAKDADDADCLYLKGKLMNETLFTLKDDDESSDALRGDRRPSPMACLRTLEPVSRDFCARTQTPLAISSVSIAQAT